MTICVGLLLAIAGNSFAAGTSYPTEPHRRDIPKVNYLGETVRGLALPATAVIRMPGSDVFVLYGFIVGRPNGTSNYFYWNADHALECHGKTVRNTDKSGEGEFICTKDNRSLMSGEFFVNADKYMKTRGSVSASFSDPGGGFASVILRWHRNRGFPDPAPLLDALN